MLALSHVYGINNPCFLFLDNRQIVYSSGYNLILYHLDNNQQSFFPLSNTISSSSSSSNTKKVINNIIYCNKILTIVTNNELQFFNTLRLKKLSLPKITLDDFIDYNLTDKI